MFGTGLFAPIYRRLNSNGRSAALEPGALPARPPGLGLAPNLNRELKTDEPTASEPTGTLDQQLDRAMHAWRDVMAPYADEFGIIRLPGAPLLQQRHVDGARLFCNRYVYLDHLPKGGVSAEVGVWKGDFSAEIIERTQPQTLHLIDIDLARFSVCERFAGNPRVQCHQGDSLEVLAKFPADTFDWVYIDAWHGYETVLAEAKLSASKLKRGGILIFNDYIFWSHNEAMPYGVVQAVNEMCVNDGWRVVAFCLQEAMYCDIAITRG